MNEEPILNNPSHDNPFSRKEPNIRDLSLQELTVKTNDLFNLIKSTNDCKNEKFLQFSIVLQELIRKINLLLQPRPNLERNTNNTREILKKIDEIIEEKKLNDVDLDVDQFHGFKIFENNELLTNFDDPNFILATKFLEYKPVLDLCNNNNSTKCLEKIEEYKNIIKEMKRKNITIQIAGKTKHKQKIKNKKYKKKLKHRK